MQRHQRIDPRRLDSAPRAVGLLAANDPTLGASERQPSQQRQRPPLIHAQRAVQARQPRAPAPRLAPLGGGLLLAPQLGEVERQPARGTVRFHQRQRHDRLARPAGEVVHVQRHPRGQQDDLGGERRDLLPRPQPEQREPHVREDPRARQPASGADEVRRRPHVRRVGLITRQAQRPVGLDRGRQLARPAVEVGPRAVGALLRADPRGGASRLLLFARAEELAQEHALGVHRDVRLQLALPPPSLVLKREQALTGEPERDACLAGSLHRGRRHGGKLDLFVDGRHLRAHHLTACWRRGYVRARSDQHLGVRERDHLAAQGAL